ncbi:hypothetical protein [Kiloniella laminariae]|uniref:hypothetical protein n=1 Tax=Kiloniella laminariae TaxID=454162 RepID=UPI00036EE19E|nr:hypothetical protein [Kiloniella laminariae]
MKSPATAQNPKDHIDLAIQQLKKGAFIQNSEVTDEVYVKLYGFGEDAVAPLLQELQKIDLTRLEHKNVLSLISGMSTILHDLDETASCTFITKALEQKCHPAIRQALEIVARFSLDDYRATTLGTIRIFEDKTIDLKQQASHKVEGWLQNLPAEDQGRISRIYILPERESYDYTTYYRPRFNIITLRWDSYAKPDNRILQVIFGRGLDFLREVGFYQEAGHCHYGHTEFDKDEKKEARIYGARIMRTLYPKLTSVLRILNKILPEKA